MIRRGDQWRLIWRKLGLRRRRAVFVIVLVGLGTLAPVAVSSLARGLRGLALDTASPDALHPDLIEVRVKYDPYHDTRSADERRALAKRRIKYLTEPALADIRQWTGVETAAETVTLAPVRVAGWTNLVNDVGQWTGAPRSLLARYAAEPAAVRHDAGLIPLVVGKTVLRRVWDPAAQRTRTRSALEAARDWVGREVTLVLGDPDAGLDRFRYDSDRKEYQPVLAEALAQQRRRREDLRRRSSDLAIDGDTLRLRARIVGVHPGNDVLLPVDVAVVGRRWLEQREQLAALQPPPAAAEPEFDSRGRTTPRPGEFSNARVVVRDRGAVEGVAKRLEALGYFASTHDRNFEQEVKAFEGFFKVVRRGTLAFAGVILALAGALLWSTTAKIVADSRPDIGLYRALGATKADIRRLFLGESVLLGSLGTMVGTVLGWLSAWGLGTLILRYTKRELGEADQALVLPDSVFSIDVWFCLLLLVLAMVVAFLAGLAPAQRAANVDPVQALRRE